MSIYEMLSESLFFGVFLSLLAYKIGYEIQRKFRIEFLNPLLIAILFVIFILRIFKISYETYQYGAKYISYFLTPATVCLAVPLYKQINILKENLTAIVISIAIGCFSHIGTLIIVTYIFKMDQQLLLSVMSKSVTTSIALGVTNEIGGIQGITVIGTMIAGLSGAVLGPRLLKVFQIKERLLSARCRWH